MDEFGLDLLLTSALSGRWRSCRARHSSRSPRRRPASGPATCSGRSGPPWKRHSATPTVTPPIWPATEAMFTMRPPWTALAQVGQGSLAAEKSPSEVDVEHCGPTRPRDVGDPGQGADPGVVDQDVQAAEMLDRQFDGTLHVLQTPDVGRYGQGLAADGAGCCLQDCGVYVYQGYPGPIGGQRLGDSQANASAGARDEAVRPANSRFNVSSPSLPTPCRDRRRPGLRAAKTGSPPSGSARHRRGSGGAGPAG